MSRTKVTTDASGRLAVVRAPFARLPDGRLVHSYTLLGETIELQAIEYGAIITNIWTVDRDGDWIKVVLGHSTLTPYLQERAYLGAVVGRYANRLAEGRANIQGRVFQLTRNEGANHLHGGEHGFHCQLWSSSRQPACVDTAGVTFSYDSRAGEEGYPGNVEASVSYCLTRSGEILIRYQATTDAPTVLNLTQHSYFNLSGQTDSSALEHELFIAADRYTPVTHDLLPTGDIAPVGGTPFDFRSTRKIAAALDSTHPQLAAGGGFDHNFVLNSPGMAAPQVRLRSPASGVTLELTTTEPGLQFYDGHFLDGSPASGNFGRSSGVCLESQKFPDSPNQPAFPPSLLLPGDVYDSSTRWRFAAA